MSKPNWTPIVIRLGDIIPWTHNPRMSNKAQAQRLIDSEKKWGQPLPFSVSPCVDGKYQLYDGHQRYSAFLTVYGENHKVAASMCDRELTDAERAELVFTLHAGATGSWDWDKVASFPEVTQWGFDADLLKNWNNDANNLKELLNSEQVESADAEPQIDRAAELQEKWQVKTGDLWQIGEHRLLCGSCTNPIDVERLKAGETPDFSFTDPPYNVGIQYGENTNDSQSKDKFIEWCKGWISYLPERHLMTVGIKRLVWWGDILGDPKWIIAWVKMNGQGQTGLGGTNKWDAILCYGVKADNKPDVIQLNNDYSEGIKASGGHPTAKPPKLWEHIIERFDGNLIYEPFGGSGTTMLAAENKKRRSLLIEIEPKYCSVILERMSTAFPELEIKRLE